MTAIVGYPLRAPETKTFRYHILVSHYKRRVSNGKTNRIEFFWEIITVYPEKHNRYFQELTRTFLQGRRRFPNWGGGEFGTHINLLTPNVNYSGRTAPLNSKISFYIFIQQIYVLNLLNMTYTLRFFLFKMQFVSYF